MGVGEEDFGGRRGVGRKPVVRAWLMARCACAQVPMGW